MILILTPELAFFLLHSGSVQEAKTIIVQSLDNLEEAANQLLEFCEDKTVVAFFGSMGAGKTTFIKAICEVLEVTENVTSPTFALVNEYSDAKQQPVFHFDFYRIKDEKEAIDIGVDEYFGSGHYCFIEWPEKVINLLPEDVVRAMITVENDRRVIKLTHG